MLRHLLAPALVCLALPATAQNITAGDGTAIANYFLSEGFSPELSRDNVGDPLIEVDFYGTEFAIYFYGCNDGGDGCNAIQFYSGYAVNGAVRLAQVNAWNTEQRYARAYVSDSGAARIEYDVYLGDTGVTENDFAAILSNWVAQQREFEGHIGW